MDDLIERVRARAADPERRVDERPSELWAAATGMRAGDLMGMVRSLGRDLRTLVDQGPNERILARAEGIQRSMNTPVARPLPAPASEAQVAATEAHLDVALPPLLRRLYLEVANGGFGPGPGLLGVQGGHVSVKGQSMERLHDTMLEARDAHDAWVWPAGLIPIVDYDGSFAAVDASTAEARIVLFDFEELDEEDEDGTGDGGWARAFSDVAPSLEAWLTSWAGPARDNAANAANAQTPVLSDVPEVTRAYWASRTPEQRAAHGLPATGWGRVLFGDAWGDDPRDQ